MNVRAQIAMVFHLDKCIGCHTCSIACKNVWTADRRGAEYMWWNNVETKPGTGYPVLYEDQERYRGGFAVDGGKLSLRIGGRVATLASLFHNPRLPSIADYYEPWTYRYDEIVEAAEGNDLPVATAISAVSGESMEVRFGSNWDDDFSGSALYAANDPNLAGFTPEERRAMFDFERLVFFYVPRICNHCLNPGCLAACPRGAIYKRGEDGIVLVNQDKCRAWRMCVSGCPYKKTYFNWATGKAEKCILCFPRQETQQVPACMHACVGRIRYLGVLLYDADGIEAAAARPDAELVEAQRALILDPFDPAVIAQAARDGVDEKIVEAARRSPVYRFVKVWRIALPHHPEFRTMPMLFYVPPLLPVAASARDGLYECAADPFSSLESARLPMRYMAALLAGGNLREVEAVYRKLIAGRVYKRAQGVGDVDANRVRAAMEEAGTTAEELEAIYRLTALAGFDERFVVPTFLREAAIEATTPVDAHQQDEGFGIRRPARRGP